MHFLRVSIGSLSSVIDKCDNLGNCFTTLNSKLFYFEGAKSPRPSYADWTGTVWTSTKYGPRLAGSAHANWSRLIWSGTKHEGRPSKPIDADWTGTVRASAEHGPGCLPAGNESRESAAAAGTKRFPARSRNGTESPRYDVQQNKETRVL